MFFPSANPENQTVGRTLVRHCSTKVEPTSQSGFTLLELLVVIALLAIIAGAATLGYEGVQDQGRADVTHYEMAEIRKALLQFRRDSGSNNFPAQGVYNCDALSTTVAQDKDPAGSETWPNGAPSADTNPMAWSEWCQHPANFWMLFINPLDKEWDKDTKRGWHGPYLQRKSGYLDIGDDLKPDDSGSPITGTPITNVWGIADPYIKPYIIESDGDEHLAWRIKTSQLYPEAQYGRPYLLFGMDTDETGDDRIVSMADNGQYDGAEADKCTPPVDPDTFIPLDFVLCLLR